MASDPLFNMAAQLVGAELNLAAGAFTCPAVSSAIIQANNLLAKLRHGRRVPMISPRILPPIRSLRRILPFPFMRQALPRPCRVRSDGSGVLLTASDNASSPDSQIWLVSYPDGKIRRITNDPNSYAGVDVTADTTTLVAVQTEVHSRMWLMPSSDSSRAQEATSGAGNDNAVGRISWTSDGRVVYGQSGGRRGLWIMDSNGGSARPLAVSPQIDEDPSICGNSGYVVFTSNRTGGSNIWRTPLDSGSPEQLTRGNVDRLPTCSPDGKWVFYQSERASGSRVWRVPTEGGEPMQIADKFSFCVAVSPSGEWVSYIWDVGTKVAIARSEGGAPVKILDISPSATPCLRWAPDSHALTYVDTVNGVSNIWRLPLDGTPARPITNFKSDRIFSHGWSRDGKYLALARGTVTSDAVLISNFR